MTDTTSWKSQYSFNICGIWLRDMHRQWYKYLHKCMDQMGEYLKDSERIEVMS